VKIYPAYARQIAALAARGIRPTAVGILFSSRWEYFDHVPKVCIKPSEWARARFEWSWLAGSHAVAIWGDEANSPSFGELLIELMQAQPALLWACDVEGKVLEESGDDDHLGQWIRDLVGPGHADPIIAARQNYRAGQERAIALELRACRAMEASGREEVAAAIIAQRSALQDRVRKTFFLPFRRTDEPRAA